MTATSDAFLRDIAHVATLFWHVGRRAYLPWTPEEIRYRSGIPDRATKDALEWMIQHGLCDRQRDYSMVVTTLRLTTNGVIVAEKRRHGIAQKDAAE